MNWRYLFLLGFIVISCTTDSSNDQKATNTSTVRFFQKLNNTGIDFNNKIVENGQDNIFLNDALLQGAGVAVLDVNADGLMDIYFAGNQVSDRLYLNKGNFQFEDITEKSGFSKDKNWSTGISIVDINGDGYDDIYVCKFFYDDRSRLKNRFYINNGDLSFTNRAEEYGLADDGHSIMANFLDYDHDGDLDVYVCNQPPSTLLSKKKLKGLADFSYTDRLYKNENGRFTDVTQAAGVTNYTYSLSATAADINNDGLTDLYVAADYDEPDLYYINNGDGTFKNAIHESMKHIGTFSMGADIADINNDGHLDIYTVDMVAEDNYRQKTNMSGMNPEKFWSLVNAGYHHQYMFNSLQLNNGNGTFSEIAQMAGISNTDWSWSPLFMDIDNDMYKDIVITNGLYKDIRNKDFEKKRDKYLKSKNNNVTPEDLLELGKMSPSFKIKNYVYRNTGNLIFKKMEDKWGLTDEGWSQGMAYADFDNDGDLDIVMTNTNQPAWIYQNSSADKSINNYLNIILKGEKKNSQAMGAKIEVIASGTTQTTNNTPYRGYMSTSQPITHFGLSQNKKADVKVTFPNGKVWQKKDVAANQTLVINITEAQGQKTKTDVSKQLFASISPVTHEHKENPFDDYQREILIPYKASSLGPVLETADINGDGTDDFYIGGSVNGVGSIFLSDGNGSYAPKSNKVFNKHTAYEDGAAHFMDVNGDGNMDLYVGSGGNEYPANHDAYDDRLYINQGNSTLEGGLIIPDIEISTGSLSTLDYNGDGTEDIFIGGRQIPGQYGKSPGSKILKKSAEQLVNVTEEEAPDFLDLGMVTDSRVADIDNDGKKELIIVGEWMPISIYGYNGEQFVKENSSAFEKSNGMWNTIEIEDIDGDGNLDIIAGNLGLNNKYKATESEPFKLYVNDFDKNGTNDVYLGFNEDGKTFPVRGRQCSSEQMPFVAEKFETYDVFGKSTVEDVLAGREEGMVTKEAYTFAHTIFYGDGKGGFAAMELPMQSQVAPVYGMAIYDFDGDGDKDLFTAGNFYDREVETTRSDAGVGCVMINDGNRKWSVMHPTETGIIANGDVRDVALLKQKNAKPVLAIANNNGPMQFYELN